MNMEFERRLAIPAEVKEQYPLSGKLGKIVEEKRAELKAVFEGRLNRLLLIIDYRPMSWLGKNRATDIRYCRKDLATFILQASCL